MVKSSRLRSGRLTLGDIVEWGGGVSSLPPQARKARVSTVWNDSRKVKKGDVFVAIVTEKDDGHRYVSAAFRAGAAAAIVDRRAAVECGAGDRGKLIRVSDPLRAVQRIAARYRSELDTFIIGITGSSGKTTTRACIAGVLAEKLTVGETFSNWNNHIGVPLSILRFTGREHVGVLEMGANHVGEIGTLSKIARPDIGLITNIGYAHIGLFGSLAATTAAKFEIVEGIDGRTGFLLLNGDDERLVERSRKTPVRILFYGVSPRCHVRPEKVSFDPGRGIGLVIDGYEFRVPLPGRHFVYSALPAIFLGRQCGVPDKTIAAALARMKPVPLRGTVERKRGVTFFVDCYNANPSSMKSALETLGAMQPDGERVAVVGDMLELGRYSRRLHRELGKMLAAGGVRKAVAIGSFGREVADGAVRAGMPAAAIAVAEKTEDALPLVRKMVSSGDVVLLKGSRGMHLETVLEKF